ncbi:MAG: Ldh family oxidoreductase [Candidatus Limnocylindrales bacterium]
MPTYADPVGGRALPAESLRTWTAAVLERHATPTDIAADVAEVLVAADRRAIASHGTARLPQYLALIEAGTMDPSARPEQVRSKAAIELFDAHNGWGHHASRVAMDAAIEGARKTGSYTAVVRASNHFGIAGWYALRAADAGLIGVSMTNTSPLVAATRGVDPVLGTNPLAVAAPAGRRVHFCLDMATSTITRGKVEVASRRHEQLQPGWAIDAAGRPTTDPAAAFEGALLPLGGVEETGGHKGYGLTLVVDLLSGVLGGSTAAPLIIPLFSTRDGAADLGQVFIAIDPDAIDEPGAFERRLEAELDLLVAARTAPDAPDRILIPGEPEAKAESRSDARGVVIDVEHHANLVEVGDRVGVPFPATTSIGL